MGTPSGSGDPITHAGTGVGAIMRTRASRAHGAFRTGYILISLSSPININASVGCNVGKKKIDCFIPVSAGGWCGDEIYNRLFMLYISSR